MKGIHLIGPVIKHNKLSTLRTHHNNSKKRTGLTGRHTILVPNTSRGADFAPTFPFMIPKTTNE
ncbi:unnamed protein product [Ceratitis capitata]|uniref:(Mediterranean fruit fly) hypothetical protein n=1 Tax=Ceratitis capitata TaxID=7213 RepID=A0A811UHP4_CERCA|nr:unnamed protein product [Ceratitis capitata]